MSVLIKPGMQPHHTLGNPLGTPGNLLGNVRSSLAQPDLAAPVEQPVVADPISQPTDAYVTQRESVKRHWSQRAGLGGGVFLAASLALGLASASLDRDVEIDHLPEGTSYFMNGEVPGLGNPDLTSAQLFAELDGEMFPMELVDGMPSDLLSSGTLASSGSNLATLLASAKPKGKWGKFKKWLGNNKGTKWLQKKLKKPAAWISKHPFAVMGITAGLFLLYLITLRMWWKARSKKSGKKIYANDIDKGTYFDTGTIFVANCEVANGQYQIIHSNEAQRDILVEFTKKPAMRLRDVLRKLYREDSEPYKRAKLNTEQEIIGRRGWLGEVGGHPDNDAEMRSEDKRYNLQLAPYEIGFFRRRWRYWRCTKRDNKLAESKWLVMRDQKGRALPWVNRWLGWMPIVGMSLKKAQKIVAKANATIVVSSLEIVGSINRDRLTNPQPNICYEIKGDSYIIHRANNNPGTLKGWQADAFRLCVDRDPGPTVTLIMIPLTTKYPELSEQEVKDFLGQLVDKRIITEEHGFYRVSIMKGTADDAKRISGGKEPVDFYMPPAPPPPPKPKPPKPQYRMTEEGSTMLIGIPGGDVSALRDWQVRAMLVAKVSPEGVMKTPDEIFRGIGMTEAQRPVFDNFIKNAKRNGWLYDADVFVRFDLDENPNLELPSRPASPPRHPKSMPAIQEHTGTKDWTDMLNKSEAEKEAAAKKAAEEEAAPPVGIGAQAQKRPLTPAESARTMVGGFGKQPASAQIPDAPDAPDAPAAKPAMPAAASVATPPAPDAPVVIAKPLVPELKLPNKPAVAAAASVTTPPASPAPPETEDVVELVADLPQPLGGRDNKETRVLTPSTVGGLAGDSKPQTMRPTKVKLRAGTETDPKLLLKSTPQEAAPAQSRDETPPVAHATPAVTFDPPAQGVAPPPTAAEVESDDEDSQTTGQFDKPAPEATPPAAQLPPEASLPLEDRRVKSDGDAKKPPQRGRKAKVRRPGEEKKTIRRQVDGVGDKDIPLRESDIEIINEGDEG